MLSAQATFKPIRPISEPVAVMLIVLIAAALRFYHLGRESLWYDELIMARLTAADAQTLWESVRSGRPPLYVTLGWVWTHLLGTSEVAMRSLSATLGLLAVPLTYLVGRQLADRRVALIGAALMAVSGFQIYYSQEHRYYALYMLLSLASLYFLVRALQHPRWYRFAGFVVFSVLSYYAQYFAVFTMAAGFAAVALLWRGLPRAARLGYVASVPLIGLGMLPGMLVPMLWMARTEHIAVWYTPLPWWAPVKTTLHFLFLAQRYTPSLALLAGTTTGVFAIGFWAWRCGVVTWGRHVIELPRRTAMLASRRKLAVILLGCWWLVPLVTMAAVSQVKPMYVDRYLIATAPAFYLLIGLAMVAAARVLQPAMALAALLIAMSGSVWTLHTHTLKDQWREAAAFLKQAAEPDDVFAFATYRGEPIESEHARQNLFWYYPFQQRAAFINLQHTPQEIVSQLRNEAGSTGRIWLVAMVWADEDMPAGLASKLTAASDDGLVQQAQDFYRANLVLMQFPSRLAAPQTER